MRRAQRKTWVWGPTPLVAPAESASATEHPVDPDTGAQRWSVQAPGLQVGLTQVLPGGQAARRPPTASPAKRRR